MKLIIITYNKSTTFNYCYQRYKDWGYKPEIFMGQNALENDISKNHICYINLKNLLKKYINYNENLLISEDDAYLLNPVDIENENKINWLGWWGRRSNAEYCGTTLLYIPKKKIKELYLKMDSRIPIHLDYYFNFYVYPIHKPKKSFTKELEHYSIIFGGIRRNRNTLSLDTCDGCPGLGTT